MRTVIFVFVLLVTTTLAQRRQQANQQPRSQDQIIFDVAQFVDNRGGFAGIVTPSPNAATLRPVLTSQELDRQQCNCVPYDMCSDNVRSIDTNSDGRIELSFFNGTCGHFLDVCCGGNTLEAVPNSGNPTNPEVPNQQEPVPPVNPNQQQPQPNNPQQPPTAPPTQQPSFPQYENRGCGLRNTGGLDFTLNDVDAKYAGFGEFPWTVAIIDRQTDACECAGSLIHPQIVLSAAHCFSKYSPGKFKVRAGEWDTQTTKERLPYQESVISQVIQHPNYNNRALFNDFALVFLETPFRLDSHIGLVCLPPQNYVSRSRDCYATGWGKDQFGKAGIYSVMLKKVPLPIVDSQSCQSQLQQTRLSQKFKLHSSFICAGGQLGVDTCEGDGGAPLACPFENSIDPQSRYVQMGIVAWGIGCNTQVPAVYGNVASVRDWIDNNVQQFGFDPSVYSV